LIEGIADSGAIAPGETKQLSFEAPAAGTYLYQDGVNAPVNRVLGLHGALVVMTADGAMTPFLGADQWTFATQWVWVLNEIDPAWSGRAQADLAIDPGEFKREFLPRYFTINGRSGSIASHKETAPDTAVHDRIGNPALIRMVNAGLAMHSPHFHGNHVYLLTHNGEVLENVMWKDNIMMMPEDRKDVFLPFVIPPNAVHWPPPEEGQKFLAELGKSEGAFPMHCHVEMSQVAGGGLYPQGMLTDWVVEL
jgi:FtsP/CotA-like multicopper oxidase with cupredoxin domain